MCNKSRTGKSIETVNQLFPRAGDGEWEWLLMDTEFVWEVLKCSKIDWW